ncbi:MAG: helix-turn-helix domain-containing protein [Planctomycetota bacterium]
MKKELSGDSGHVRGQKPAYHTVRDNELVLLRSNLLEKEDRTLLQMVLDRGSTFEQIARLTGKSPSTISRRFHRILNQLLARELTALLEYRKQPDPVEISIARAYFVQGLTQKQVCEKVGVTAYRVRTTIAGIRKIIYHNTMKNLDH